MTKTYVVSQQHLIIKSVHHGDVVNSFKREMLVPSVSLTGRFVTLLDYFHSTDNQFKFVLTSIQRINRV